jgi:phosphinothricin acetyltransferase
VANDRPAATIEQALEADADELADIYNHYIQNTVATFEEEVVSAADLRSRMADVAAAGYPWLVMREKDRMLGYAYANRWNPRSAYRHSAEVTIYLSPDCTSRGIGTQLYEALFSRLREMPVHVVIGGITLPAGTIASRLAPQGYGSCRGQSRARYLSTQL